MILMGLAWVTSSTLSGVEFPSSPFSGAGETAENNKMIQKKHLPLIIQKKEKGSFVYWMTYSS